jgi:hypothetical protein
MDQYEEELEYRIACLNEILGFNDRHQLLGEYEIVSIEGEQHTLQERLYQYRLKKEEDARIQIHPRQEPSV